MPSAVEAWNLSHWITREVPTSFLRYSSQNLTVFLLMRFGYGPLTSALCTQPSSAVAVSVPLWIEGDGCCPLDGTADVTGADLE